MDFLFEFACTCLLLIKLYAHTGGDSKTLMFVQISPSDKDLGETLSSLNFATRVRGVELGPAKKQTDLNELQKTKTMVNNEITEKNSAISFVTIICFISWRIQSSIEQFDDILWALCIDLLNDILQA